MPDTLWHVTKKYELADPKHARQPVELPDVDRDDLASLFFELGYETGVELGVETGKYSEVLLKRNPNLRLFCVDAWKAYQGYRDHVTQSKVDGLLATAKDRLAPFEGRVKFIRKFSVEASRDFRDTSLDFVYIDANHGLPWVMDDICAWEKKVRKGGIVAGHDYCRRGPGPYQCHVVQAVNAYTDAFFISPWFVVGRKDVKEGEKRDRPRSWFWVKE